MAGIQKGSENDLTSVSHNTNNVVRNRNGTEQNLRCCTCNEFVPYWNHNVNHFICSVKLYAAWQCQIPIQSRRDGRLQLPKVYEQLN